MSLFFTMGVTMVSLGQTALLNQYDADGKKHGKWMVYLDAIGSTRVKDSTMAVYKRYNWYDHGVNLNGMSTMTEIGGRIETTGAAARAAGSVMLDGEYKCYNKKGNLWCVFVFSKGEYVSYKEYEKDGKLLCTFDYTKHCDGEPHSFYYYTYDENGKVETEDCYKKESAIWPRRD